MVIYKVYRYPEVKMKVLFALSNPPSAEFVWTRHNVGRLFVTEHLVKKYPFDIKENKHYNSYTLKSNPQVVVCLTKTYMNLSGQAVNSFMKKHPEATKSNFMVVHDDLEHRLGYVRIKDGGSAQGHNGVQSVVGALGKDFKRLQLGIDRPNSRDPEVVASYVLHNFSKKQRLQLPSMFQKAEQLLRKQHFL